MASNNKNDKYNDDYELENINGNQEPSTSSGFRPQPAIDLLIENTTNKSDEEISCFKFTIYLKS